MDYAALSVHGATALTMWLEGMGIPGIPGAAPMAAQAKLIDAGRSSYALACVIGVLSNWGGSLSGYWLLRLGTKLPSRRSRPRKKKRRTGKLNRIQRIIRVKLRQIGRWGILGPSWARGLVIAVSRSVGSLRTPVTLTAGIQQWPAAHWAAWTLAGSVLHVLPWQWIIYLGLRDA